MGVLDGKVAVITGSSHGLGFAIAEAYEKKLKPLSAVIRLWAKPLSVPAEKAVWLAHLPLIKKLVWIFRCLAQVDW